MSEWDYEWDTQCHRGQSWVEGVDAERLIACDINGLARDDDDGWYFWDETGGAAFGPYLTSRDAQDGCRLYAETL